MASLQKGAVLVDDTAGGTLIINGSNDAEDIWIGNDNGSRIYLGIGADAVVKEGIFIDSGFQISLSKAGVPLKSIRSQIKGIVATGTADATFQELK